MKLYRIIAVVWRHIYHFIKSYDRLADAIYWPVLDILLWGITTKWIVESSSIPHLALLLLSGLVYWQIVWRSNYEISVNLLEEIWNSNLVNLFSTPLKFGEWIIGLLSLSIAKMIITVIVGFGSVWFLYSINMFSIGWITIPFMMNLIVSGWIMGIFASSFIIYYGQSIQTIAWMAGFIFAPFSAIYYPVTALPKWVQPISNALPTTHVFEGLREHITSGNIDLSRLYISMGLNALYFILSLTFLKFMFEKSKEKGLARLE